MTNLSINIYKLNSFHNFYHIIFYWYIYHFILLYNTFIFHFIYPFFTNLFPLKPYKSIYLYHHHWCYQILYSMIIFSRAVPLICLRQNISYQKYNVYDQCCHMSLQVKSSSQILAHVWLYHILIQFPIFYIKIWPNLSLPLNIFT